MTDKKPETKRKPTIHTTISEDHFEKMKELKKISRRSGASLMEEAIEIMLDKYKNK